MRDDTYEPWVDSVLTPEDPTDEFRAQLRADLETEWRTAGAVAPAMPVTPDEPRRRWIVGRPALILAAAAALVVIAVASVATIRRSDAEPTVPGDTGVLPTTPSDDAEPSVPATTTPTVTTPITTADDDVVPATAPAATAAPAVVPPVPGEWTGASTADACPGIAAATPDGALWLGSHGLYRWDGTGWSWITHDQGVPTSPGFDPDVSQDEGEGCGSTTHVPRVTELAAADDGTLWMVAGDDAGHIGLVSYDGETFTVHGSPPESEPTRDVWGEGLHTDRSGGVWLYLTEYERPDVTADPDDPELFTGAARLAPNGEWAVHPLDQHLPLGHRFAVGADGTAWFAGPQGVWRLVDGAWLVVDTGPVDEVGEILLAAAGPDGDLWVSILPRSGPTSSLGHWVDGDWEIHPPTAVLSDVSIWEFTMTSDGVLWIAASPVLDDFGPDDGDPVEHLVLISFDGDEFVAHRPEVIDGDVRLDLPYSITTDGTSLWVGSMPGGDVVRYTPTS